MYSSNVVFDDNRYGKLNVLIVDDQSMVANSLANTLLHLGFNAKVTDKIDEMKKILNLEKVDVVLMEYAYRNGQGIEEIKNAKIKSKNSKVKFVVTSVSGEHTVKDNAITHQCDLFLVKPISSQELAAEIKKVAKQEYRKAERVKCHIAFKVIHAEIESDTFATDISTDGAHLLDENHNISPKIGEEIVVKFTIPKALEDINITATVVRLSNNGFGIQFKSITQQEKNKIKLNIIQ